MGKDKMAKELICQVFTDTVNNYFHEITKIESETGLPYLKDTNQQIIDDFTGMIGISGSRKGFVYVTSTRELFRELVKIILAIDEPSKEQIIDMAGEIANTVSGNVRQIFGSEFMISVPVIIEGKPKNLKFPTSVPEFVIPIKWKNYTAHIVIGIE